MRIPIWIWIILGLTAISWIVPDGIPGEEFVLPAIAITGLILRRLLMNSIKSSSQQVAKALRAHTRVVLEVRVHFTTGLETGQGRDFSRPHLLLEKIHTLCSGLRRALQWTKLKRPTGTS